jgi:hypothetical protein
MLHLATPAADDERSLKSKHLNGLERETRATGARIREITAESKLASYRRIRIGL